MKNEELRMKNDGDAEMKNEECSTFSSTKSNLSNNYKMRNDGFHSTPLALWRGVGGEVFILHLFKYLSLAARTSSISPMKRIWMSPFS